MLILVQLEYPLELISFDVSLNPSEHLRDRFLPHYLPLPLVYRKVNPLFEEVARNQPAATVDEHLDLLREKSALG